MPNTQQTVSIQYIQNGKKKCLWGLISLWIEKTILRTSSNLCPFVSVSHELPRANLIHTVYWATRGQKIATWIQALCTETIKRQKLGHLTVKFLDHHLSEHDIYIPHTQNPRPPSNSTINIPFTTFALLSSSFFLEGKQHPALSVPTSTPVFYPKHQNQ